ncbi:MAG: hypothetical protein ABIQ73_04520 [Acidimicrobiales bacterium]
MLAFGGTASAQNDDDHGWTVSTFSEGPISFSIVAGTGPNQCPNLPDGVTVSGSATINHVVKTRTDRGGITHVVDRAESNGVATGNGNSYEYSYDNVVRAKNSQSDPDTIVGTMKDAFTLKLGHRTVLHNGFLANLTVGPGAPGGLGFYLLPIYAFGDPFAFPNGGGRCDPI